MAIKERGGGVGETAQCAERLNRGKHKLRNKVRNERASRKLEATPEKEYCACQLHSASNANEKTGALLALTEHIHVLATILLIHKGRE